MAVPQRLKKSQSLAGERKSLADESRLRKRSKKITKKSPRPRKLPNAGPERRLQKWWYLSRKRTTTIARTIEATTDPGARRPNPENPPAMEKARTIVRADDVEEDADDAATTKEAARTIAAATEVPPVVPHVEAAEAAEEIEVVVAVVVVEKTPEADLIVDAAPVVAVVAETIGQDGFAASLQVPKSLKERSRVFWNFTRSSTASCGIRQKITSLRNLTRSSPARLLRKLSCGRES